MVEVSEGANLPLQGPVRGNNLEFYVGICIGQEEAAFDAVQRETGTQAA